jgi:hypothetical protein
MPLAGPAFPHLLPVILCGQTSRLCWSTPRPVAKLAPEPHYPDPRDALCISIIPSALHPATAKPLPLPHRHFS